jgi:hypothetical protein
MQPQQKQARAVMTALLLAIAGFGAYLLYDLLAYQPARLAGHDATATAETTPAPAPADQPVRDLPATPPAAANRLEQPLLPPTAQAPRPPLCARLARVQPAAARAGDVIELHGQFAPEQGPALPVINRGRRHDLIVLHWSPTVVRARIPTTLAAGHYRVGVYCPSARPEDKPGTLYSSGFLDFLIQ